MDKCERTENIIPGKGNTANVRLTPPKIKTPNRKNVIFDLDVIQSCLVTMEMAGEKTAFCEYRRDELEPR